MTVSQVGTFEHGTSGFTVRIKLGESNIGIAWATEVNIKVTRPSEAEPGIDRNLGTESIIDNVVGIIGWPVQDGDLTVEGTYEILVTVTGPNQTLPVDATLKVT